MGRSSVELLEKVVGIISKAENVQSPKLVIESYKFAVLVLFEYKETDKCIKLLHTLKGVARWHGDTVCEMFAYEQLGNCANICFDFEKATDCYSKMLRLALYLKDTKAEFRSYDHLSKQFFYLNKPWMSNFFHKKMLEGDYEPEDSDLRKLVISDVDRRMGYNTYLVSLPGYKSIGPTDFEALRLQALVRKDAQNSKDSQPRLQEMSGPSVTNRSVGKLIRTKVDLSSFEAVFETVVSMEHEKEMKLKKKLAPIRKDAGFRADQAADKKAKTFSSGFGSESGDKEISEYDRVMGKMAMNLQLHNNLKSGGFFNRIVEGQSSSLAKDTAGGQTQSVAHLKDTLAMQNSNHQFLNHLSPNRNFRLYQQGAFATPKVLKPTKGKNKKEVTSIRLEEAPQLLTSLAKPVRSTEVTDVYITGSADSYHKLSLEVSADVAEGPNHPTQAQVRLQKELSGSNQKSPTIQATDFKVASYEIHLKQKSVEKIRKYFKDYIMELDRAKQHQICLATAFRVKREEQRREADRLREEEARDFAVSAIKSFLGSSHLGGNEGGFSRVVAQSQMSGRRM